MSVGSRANVNGLIGRLPSSEAARIEPLVTMIRLNVGDILCAVDGRITHAVFPSSGLVSLVGVSAEGATLELGIVGREGMFGLPLVLGARRSSVRALVQGDGRASCIEARHFAAILADCPTLRSRAHRYTARLMSEVGQTAVCNCFHSLESRTARWMLLIADRSGSDTFTLTQALLASMLGVLRPAVSRAASALQEIGALQYSRGNVRILDRPALSDFACSCYVRPTVSLPSLRRRILQTAAA